jgi:dTDP-4-dehydrorhamnose reductase
LALDRQYPVHAAGEMRPVVVVGAAGQLGETVAARLTNRYRVVPLTRSDLDLRASDVVRERLRVLGPAAIVNCAAFNQVDDAEERATEALEVNAFVVSTLARTAAELGATLVHYSTDFVFDGEASTPYREEDRPNPRGVYAASKLLGEWFAADASSHYVLRVESLFGGRTRRKGSFDSIIDAVQANRTARVFTDRVVSPSYVWDVADATASLLEQHPTPGVYHCVNSGFATWFDVACEVRRQLGSSSPLEPVTMNQAALRAPRPRYCALSNEKLRSVGITMPSWQDALRRALTERMHGTTQRTKETI